MIKQRRRSRVNQASRAAARPFDRGEEAAAAAGADHFLLALVARATDALTRTSKATDTALGCPRQAAGTDRVGNYRLTECG